MSPAFARQRRAQLLAELRELDRLEAIAQPPCAECAAATARNGTETAASARPRETINILGANWEVKSG
jgi:hypothetical protein